MPSHKAVTEAAANKFKEPESGQIDHFDRQYPGLALRVSCGGRKSWVYLCRIGGKQKRFTLGLFPAELGVAEAHDAWRKMRDQVRAGRTPIIEGGSESFRSVFEEWIKRDQADNRSVGVVRGMFVKDVLPSWAHRPIGSIGRRDALAILDAVTDRAAPITANRLHAYLRRMFRWAIGRGLITTNPIEGLPKPSNESKRDRVLTDAELVKVWNAAEEMGYPYGPALQLLILTGARLNEIGQLRWSEIGADSIELPGERTKNEQPHSIPLSTAAREIIAALPRIDGSQFVFTNTGTVPINAWGRAKARLDERGNIAAWTLHDLRRTMATGLQKLGTPLQVTEAILNHVSGSRAGIVGVYQRHDYAGEKRAALEAWGNYIVDM
ncbi:MAG: tyrosine-type recombinase/integrase [Methyloceanibacter sp.]